MNDEVKAGRLQFIIHRSDFIVFFPLPSRASILHNRRGGVHS
jgi:hypothetical protein